MPHKLTGLSNCLHDPRVLLINLYPSRFVYTDDSRRKEAPKFEANFARLAKPKSLFQQFVIFNSSLGSFL